MSFLKVSAIGNIGKISEIRQTQSQLQVVDFSLATNEKVKNKSGEWEKVTTWLKCTVFGKQAELCAQYLDVGKLVYVEGKLRQDNWETRDGVNKTTLLVIVDDIQFLSFSDEKVNTTINNTNKESIKVIKPIVNDDDIPF